MVIRQCNWDLNPIHISNLTLIHGVKLYNLLDEEKNTHTKTAKPVDR